MNFKLFLENNQYKFLGPKDLELTLNDKLNEFTFLKNKNPHRELITYVEIEYDEYYQRLFANIFIGKLFNIQFTQQEKEILINATKYYLTEFGCELGSESTKTNNLAYKIEIIYYPKEEPDFKKWKHVPNFIKELLIKGDLIDVADIGYEIENGLWKLNNYLGLAANYYDSKNNKYILSIGQHKYTKEIYAAIDLRFAKENENYEPIWIK